MAFSAFSSFTKYSFSKIHGSKKKKERDHLLYLYNMDAMGMTKKYNPNTILANWVTKKRECEKNTQ